MHFCEKLANKWRSRCRHVKGWCFNKNRNDWIWYVICDSFLSRGQKEEKKGNNEALERIASAANEQPFDIWILCLDNVNTMEKREKREAARMCSKENSWCRVLYQLFALWPTTYIQQLISHNLYPTTYIPQLIYNNKYPTTHIPQLISYNFYPNN